MIHVYRKPIARVASWVVIGFLAGLVLPAAAADKPATPPAAPAAAAAPTAAVGPEAMKGLTWDGLSEEQKKLSTSILNEGRCDCGCGMTLAVCRRDDEKCSRSLGLATQVLALSKDGKTKEEIVKAVLAPPSSKFVQFPIPAGDAPFTGPADAKVTILDYYDYQCPFCIRVAASLEEVAKMYPNDVRIVYKQHPLPMHQQAGLAARAALAAQKQGKFFEMHKKLFESSSTLSPEKINEFAKTIGLDMERYAKDLDSPEIAARIDKETKEVMDIGATGTPASFVNGRYVNGAKPASFFKEMVDEELEWAKDNNRPTFTVGKNVREASPAKEAQGPDPNKVYDIAVGSAPVLGPANAKVTLLHFYDYQCPFCVRVHPTLDQLLKEYPADVRIAYKQHPLSMHPQAMIAAEAAMAADAQGKFREMHDKLMQISRELSREKIFEAAKGLGLDMDRFTKDIDTHVHKAAIDAMTKEAMTNGATGTPASFVNGKYISGAAPYDNFKKLVDQALGNPNAPATATKAGSPAAAPTP